MRSLIEALSNSEYKDYFLNKPQKGQFHWKKYYLTYDSNKGWSVVSLNLIQRLLRHLNFYKDTHKLEVRKEFLQSFSLLKDDGSDGYKAAKKISELFGIVSNTGTQASETFTVQKSKSELDAIMKKTMKASRFFEEFKYFYRDHKDNPNFQKTINNNWKAFEKRVKELFSFKKGKNPLMFYTRKDYRFALAVYAKRLIEKHPDQLFEKVLDWAHECQDDHLILLKFIHFLRSKNNVDDNATYRVSDENVVVSKKDQEAILDGKSVPWKKIERFYKEYSPPFDFKKAEADSTGIHRALYSRIREKYKNKEDIPAIYYKNPFVFDEVFHPPVRKKIIVKGYELGKEKVWVYNWVSNDPSVVRAMIDCCINDKDKNYKNFKKIFESFRINVYKHYDLMTEEFAKAIKSQEIENNGFFNVAELVLVLQKREIPQNEFKKLIYYRVGSELIINNFPDRFHKEFLQLLREPPQEVVAKHREIRMYNALLKKLRNTPEYSEKLFTYLLKEEKDIELYKKLSNDASYVSVGFIKALENISEEEIDGLNLDNDSLALKGYRYLRSNDTAELNHVLLDSELLYQLTQPDNIAQFIYNCFESNQKIENFLSRNYVIQELIELGLKKDYRDLLSELLKFDFQKFVSNQDSMITIKSKGIDNCFPITEDRFQKNAILGLKLLFNQITIDEFMSTFQFSDKGSIIKGVFLNLPVDKQVEFLEKLPDSADFECIQAWIILKHRTIPLDTDLPDTKKAVPSVDDKTGLDHDSDQEKFPLEAAKKLFEAFWKKEAKNLKNRGLYPIDYEFSHVSKPVYQVMKETLIESEEIDEKNKAKIQNLLKKYDPEYVQLEL